MSATSNYFVCELTHRVYGCPCLQGIRVNAINPATVVTNFFTSAGMSHDQAEAYMTKSAKTHPIGRVGTPADIAELCYFLTDNSKAGWITGQVRGLF